MTRDELISTIKHTPFRVLLPSVLMLALFAGSIFLYLLPSLERALMDTKKEVILEITGSVMSTLEYLDGLAQKGEISVEKAQAMGVKHIRAMRYGSENKDYFWIMELHPRMLMHPYRPDLNGQDLTDFRDKQGKRLFVEFSRIIRDEGGGFVDYYWQWKDQPDRIARKLSYIREYKPWGWVVGTGLYLDDVEVQIAVYRNRVSIIFLCILFVFILLSSYVLRQASLAERKKEAVLSQREKLVKVLKESEERYRTIADFAYDWEAWVGTDNAILYCSPACERITGYPQEQFFARPELVREIIVEEDKPEWDGYLPLAGTKQGESLDFRIRRADDTVRWISVVGRSVSGIGDKPLGVRFSFRDITERKNMEEQLRYQALHDPLTNLANRTLCLDRISQAMHRATRRDNYFFAVIFLDLDRFKIINDSLGHHFGDMVLTETAVRLTAEMRGLDTVSRFGGDEFVLLLDELSSPGEAIRIIKRIRRKLSEPFRFMKNEVQTTASFGIVLSPMSNENPADVLQHANIAMHRAKEAGRNRFKVFTERMLENAVDLLTLENDMRRGIDTGEFHVVFQPIVDINDLDIIGFEALSRWDHPERGSIPPSDFIPMAEESGVILKLGEWVLRESVRTLATWRKEISGTKDLFISVNLSSKQFTRIELDKTVLDILREFDLPPRALKLEITESALMDNPDSAVRTLNRLREAGVRFSIDDFGTGYSSLSQLQQLPVDTLKVDRSFITRMKTDPENMEIVKAVIALAHSLDLNVIAEGVEAPDQLCSLLELQCNCVQGFFFHKPLSGDSARDLLMRRETTTNETTRQKIIRAQKGCQGNGTDD